MSLRRPVVAGLGVGAGASTLAAALHAHEIGRLDGGGAVWLDVLACRSDVRSLRRALALGTGSRPRPVLAIAPDAPDPPLGDGSTAAAGPPGAQLTALRARFGAVVVLPEVDRWRERVALAEAAAVLAEPAGTLPRSLRDYAAALQLVVTAVLADGGPGRSSRPPLVTIARAGRPPFWPPAARPAVQLTPLRPWRPGTPDPDDDAIEAELAEAEPAGRGRAG